MKQTMSQIAEKLGLSRNAVSAVINGRAGKLGISKETAARVHEYLDGCGYVRSGSAVSLKQGVQSGATGILYCGDFLHYRHLTDALLILSRELRGRNDIFEMSGVEAGSLRDGIAVQLSKGISRLVWIHANPPEEELRNAEKLFPLLGQIPQSVIYNYDFGPGVWDEEYLKRGISLVGFDRLKSYSQIADAFVQNGCTHAALYEVPLDFAGCTCAPVRKMAEIFRSKGLEVYGLSGDGDRRDFAFSRLMELCRSGKRAGVFIRDDSFAADMAFRLMREGIRIPGDIVIASFGNSEFLQYLPVPVTSVEVPVRALCESLLGLLRSDFSASLRGERIVLDCTVQWRKSLSSNK